MRDVCSPAARATATGRRRIPLVLAAGVHVDVGDALHHGSDFALRPNPFRPARRPARRGPPARPSAAGCATPRRADAPRSGRRCGDVRRGERDALRGQRDRAGDQFAGLPQRDMHRPVVASEFGELPGAVERVDDPHPLGGQSDRIVGAFLGEHRVTGPLGGQRRHQEVVRPLVPRRLSLARLASASSVADTEQQLAGLVASRCGERHGRCRRSARFPAARSPVRPARPACAPASAADRGSSAADTGCRCR